MNNTQTNIITIHSYNPQDYQGVKDTLEDAGLFYEDMDAEIRYTNKIFSNPDSILIAWDGRQIIGLIVIVEEWGPLLFRLAIRKSYRNKGTGSGLLENAEMYLRKKYHREAHLLVDDSDRDLIRFYEKRGYQKGNVYRWLVKKL
jgi:GNAT superfamily N-acetyltransferase